MCSVRRLSGTGPKGSHACDLSQPEKPAGPPPNPVALDCRWTETARDGTSNTRVTRFNQAPALAQAAPIRNCHRVVTDEATGRVLAKADPSQWARVRTALPEKVATIVATEAQARELGKIPAEDRAGGAQAIVDPGNHPHREGDTHTAQNPVCVSLNPWQAKVMHFCTTLVYPPFRFHPTLSLLLPNRRRVSPCHPCAYSTIG